MAPDDCFMCPPAGAVELLGRVDPMTIPAPAPDPSGQPASGDGWRLLGDGAVGEPYSVRFAQNLPTFESIWTSLALPGPVPAVDFEREVVVVFGAAVSGSCPEIRFDGIGVVTEPAIFYSRFTYGSDLASQAPGEPLRACTADANPHSFVVAVSRDILPASRFKLRLARTFVCGSCPNQELDVSVAPVATPVPTPDPTLPTGNLETTASVERDGVRVRIELDRNPMPAGEPTWVATTVTNIGDDDLIWLHGGCAISVGVNGRMNGRRWSFGGRPDRRPAGIQDQVARGVGDR
jgi:hypothetical protein